MNIFSAILENPKEYIRFADREPGEILIFLLRKHPITNLPWIITTFVLIALPTVLDYILNVSDINLPLQFGLVTNFIFYLFAAIYSFESFLIWYYNVYIVTDRRLIDIDFYGFFYKKVSETQYDKVEDTSYSQSGVAEILFNYGDIFIQTAAETNQFEFISIPAPQRVYDKITDLIAQNKKND